MLGSITPLGERARRQRWWVTMAFFGLGSVGGGMLLGLLPALVGSTLDLDSTVALWALAGLVALGLALDLGLAGLRLPTLRRQVDEEWLGRYRGWVYGLGFGAQLGVGLATIVTLSATYAAIAAAFLSGSLVAGLAIGAAFGAGRWAGALAGGLVRRPDQLARLARALRRLDAPSRRLALAAEACAAAVLVGLAAG